MRASILEGCSERKGCSGPKGCSPSEGFSRLEGFSLLQGGLLLLFVLAAPGTAFGQDGLPGSAPAPPSPPSSETPTAAPGTLPDAILYEYPMWIGPRAWHYFPSRSKTMTGDPYAIHAIERDLSEIRRQNERGSWEDGDFGSVVMKEVVMEHEMNENVCSEAEAEQMQAEYGQCMQATYDEYDVAHRPPSLLQDLWRPFVPEGWYQGKDLAPGSPDREAFMNWCMSGGQDASGINPANRMWYDQWARNQGVKLMEWFTAQGEWPSERARQERCDRFLRQVIDDRQTAFLELCEAQNEGGKGNPYPFDYTHFAGCNYYLDTCDNISEGCTSRWTEYHYYEEREYNIPCAPIDAFRWEGRGARSDQWEGKDGVSAQYVGGKAGRVWRVDNRGFVGSGGLLNVIGAGGKEMEVMIYGPALQEGAKIGSYFYFDLSSGTVGFNSFDEAKPTQYVTLPSIAKEVDNRGMEYAHLDDLQGQRDQAHGYVLHLYFCEKTFPEEERERLQKAWKPTAQGAEGLPLPCSPETNVPLYGELPEEWRCGYDPGY